MTHRCGEYAFFPKPEPGAIGALILDGVIVVRTRNGVRGHVEVMGAGDLISPWVSDDGAFTTSTAITASVLRSARFAYLSRDFATRIARWPELYAALIHRLVLRARRLSFQGAVNAEPRVDERLEMTLWHLAERFGRVTRDGVAVELPLTHAQLGELVAAQRPSVTSALTRLARADRVVPAQYQCWILRGDPAQALDALHRQSGLAR